MNYSRYIPTYEQVADSSEFNPYNLNAIESLMSIESLLDTETIKLFKDVFGNRYLADDFLSACGISVVDDYDGDYIITVIGR